MTVGSTDSPNLYVMYTDLMCPYCDVFSRVVMDHWDEFTAYLDEHHILFEVRLTDYLYEAVDSEYSRASAEGVRIVLRVMVSSGTIITAHSRLSGMIISRRELATVKPLRQSPIFLLTIGLRSARKLVSVIIS